MFQRRDIFNHLQMHDTKYLFSDFKSCSEPILSIGCQKNTTIEQAYSLVVVAVVVVVVVVVVLSNTFFYTFCNSFELTGSRLFLTLWNINIWNWWDLDKRNYYTLSDLSRHSVQIICINNKLNPSATNPHNIKWTHSWNIHEALALIQTCNHD